MIFSGTPRAAGALRWPPAALALACALLLSACANPGPDRAPLAMSTPAAAGLDASADAAALAPPQWWQALGDARLDALVQQALQDSPSMAIARARLEQAIALSQVREAANGPQAQLGADLTRQHYTANGMIPPPVAGHTYNSANLQASLSWSLDFFGRHAAELQAALGQARAAQADAAQAANVLAAQVANAYVALARLHAQQRVMQRLLEQRSEQLALTEERVHAGLDNQVTLAQTQAAVPDARTQIEALDEQITLTRRQLAVLCGQAPDAQATLAPQLSALHAGEMPTQLGADLLGRRPDVVAARWRVEAAGHGVDAARKAFYPDINLGAFVGLNALGLDQLLRGSSRQIGVAPALRLPLFDGGLLRAQLGSQRAEQDAAIAQYNALVLQAAQQAGDAIASLQSLARQQTQQAQAGAAAERAYDFAQQRYRAGLGGYLVVLASETQVLAQRQQGVDLLARQLSARIALMQALGGGWPGDGAPLPATAATATTTAAPLSNNR
ncbi:efflux transporter outer membrane subunit [Comamonas faecalis]|uniref:Efflux transporter outer membrane subunit n=1 Tax=Comamonas faecalis TaxID=1387849 RepID=A0ABP7RGR4_9BURK